VKTPFFHPSSFFNIGNEETDELFSNIRYLKLLQSISLAMLLYLACIPYAGICQSDADIRKANSLLDRFSDKMLSAMERKYAKLEKKLTASSKRSLEKLQKQEAKLQKKLAGKDSLAARQLLLSTKEKYTAQLAKLSNPGIASSGSVNTYLPGLDSLQTTFSFLEKMGGKVPGLDIAKLQQVKDVSSQFKSLQAQMQQAGNIKQFLKERKQLLKEQFDKLGIGDQLKQMNKEVYYYQQQFNEYKSLLSDPDKLEKKILSLVREMPAFKNFMAENSMLSQLFGSPSAPVNGANLQSLQTRASVQQQLTGQFGSSGSNPQQFLQQQVQQAQTELGKLKDKINQFGGGSSDLEMPEFKPNNQKTKSFWKRIEYGLNIQSQKTNSLLPVTSDIALTAGYKLNDKSVIGIGAGYKLGWGKSLSGINITSQGVSLRVYADVKLKGSFWITSGYEENYQHEFTKLDQLKDLNAWQKSGLAGVTKKYKVGKKNGNMQLLWDFLSYSQLPQTQPLKFRIGYVF
jgi:hypothetical protein